MAPGQVIKVDLMAVEPGAQVELDRVLMIADDDKVIIGNPVIAGASVKAESLGIGKDRKVIVFKYKPKTRYRRKKGHRQLFTSLAVKDISPGEVS